MARRVEGRIKISSLKNIWTKLEPITHQANTTVIQMAFNAAHKAKVRSAYGH